MPHDDEQHSHEHHGHDQPPGHGSHARQTSSRALGVALVLTLAFSVAEAAGGWWTGSLALWADAGHMVSDAAALGIAWLAAFIARRPADQRRTMGYQRAEVLGALVNSTSLCLLAGWIVVEAVHRLAAPPEVKGLPLLAIATLGLLVNLVLARVLHGAHAGHSHDNLNLRAALWHVMGDALGSVGAMLAGLLLWWKSWSLVDPIVSVAIAAILAVGGLNLAMESVRVLMQSSPREVDLAHLQNLILQVPGVLGIHQLHTWVLTPGENVLSVHVVVATPEGAVADVVTITDEVHRRLQALNAFAHITVQPEHAAHPCEHARRQ